MLESSENPTEMELDEAANKMQQQSDGNLDVDKIEIGELADFDSQYFEDLKKRDKRLRGWLASEDCKNVQYFTVLSNGGERLGIIGVYDGDDDKNITHTIVDPKYRGMGFARKFKDALMGKLNLPFITMTINYDPHAPDDPSRTNVSSIRSAEKLPGIERVNDSSYEKIQKAKFIYRRREEITDNLSEDKIKTLKKIKRQIDEGELEGKDWGEIRRNYGIPLGRIGDKGLILNTLGADTLIKYFSALSGEARPYKFTLPLAASDILEYINYELSDTPAHLILDLLKKPLSRAGVNILISHCIHIPHFTAAIIEKFPGEDLNSVLKQIPTDHPEAEPMLNKIFDKKRISYLKDFNKYNENNPAPQELVDEFKKYEQGLFGESAR